MLRSDPIDNVDGVVCVGGDGMFSELFNGLLLRSMDEHNERQHEDSSQFEVRAPKLRVGLIPGGSTNAVALSLHGTTDVVTAALHILIGDRRNIDVSSARSEDNKFYR
jgi:ceramide kinase